MWPMWLRIAAVPFRILALVICIIPFMLILFVDSDKASDFMSYVLEVGNVPSHMIGI